MKKFISLLLVCIMLTGLIGCSSEKIENAKELIDWYEENESFIEKIGNELSELEENNKVDDDVITDNDNQMWIEKEISAPNIPAIAVKENYIDEDTVKKTYSTFLNFTVEDIRNATRNNVFLTENFILADMNLEEISNERFTDLGDRQWYRIREGIIGANKQSSSSDTRWFSDFDLLCERETDYADNYNYFYLRINEVETDTLWQENIYSILTNLLGQNIAEYICYAKDLDGESAIDGKNLSDFCLDEYVKTDGGQYRFRRTVSEERILIIIELDTACLDRTYYSYFDGGYVPVLHNDTQNLNKIFNENNVGNLNFNTSYSLFDNYFKEINSEYTRTLINDLQTTKKQGDNNITVYDVSADVMGGYPGLGTLTAPELDVNYEIITKEDNSIIDMEIEIVGSSIGIVVDTETDVEKEEAYNQLLINAKKQINLLFPEMDLSSLTIEEVKTKKWITGTYNLNDMDCIYKIKVETGVTFAGTYDNEFTVVLEYNVE